MKNISIIIKTFIRLNCLERLLESLPSKYFSIPILIFDDGYNCQDNRKYILNKFKNLNINYITCSEDMGLSYGRNILVDNVKTKYFLLCDDDFIFSKKTNLEYSLERCEKLDADIYAGVCLHSFRVNFQGKKEKIQLLFRKFQQVFHLYRKISYIGTIEKNDDSIVVINNGIKYNKNVIYRTDICENFFIGKTDVIKKIRWNDDLKISEHEDFFVRCKDNRLRIYLDTKFKIYHFPETNANFHVKRARDDFWKIVLKANNVKSLLIYRNNVGIVENFQLNNDQLIYTKKESKNLKGILNFFGNKIFKN